MKLEGKTLFLTFFRSVFIALYTVILSASIFAGPIHDAANVGDITKAQQIVARNPEIIEAKDAMGATPLLVAASAGQKEFTEWLLAHGANVNAKAYDLTTPLHWAAQRGNNEIISLLLRNKADVNAKNDGGETPLQCAILSSPHVETARLLIAAGADVNARNILNRTPLLQAVMEMREKALEVLITNGAVVDIFSAVALGDHALVEGFLMRDKKLLLARENGLTLLHIAAAWGQADMAALLINKGLIVDVTTPEAGTTPLHTAASFGRTNVVKILLQKGSPVDARTFNKQTALHLASGPGHEECVALLLDTGANPDARDNKGQTALHLAASGGRNEVIKLLLAKKADPNIPSLLKDMPLHIAVKSGNLQVVQSLLNASARVDARDSKGQTALHCAAYLTVNETNIEKSLLDFGANIDAKDKGRNSPLHFAAKYNTPSVVSFLLAKGASVNSWNWKGETPLGCLMLETSNEQGEVARILRLNGGREYSYPYRILIATILLLSSLVAYVAFCFARRRKGKGH